jgi:hypothetical protein
MAVTNGMLGLDSSTVLPVSAFSSENLKIALSASASLIFATILIVQVLSAIFC